VGEAPGSLVSSLAASAELAHHNHRVAAVDPRLRVKLGPLPGLRDQRQNLVCHRLDPVVGTAIEEPLELGLDPLDLGMKSFEHRLHVAAP
jgi:hypothetical protein